MDFCSITLELIFVSTLYTLQEITRSDALNLLQVILALVVFLKNLHRREAMRFPTSDAHKSLRRAVLRLDLSNRNTRAGRNYIGTGLALFRQCLSGLCKLRI